MPQTPRDPWRTIWQIATGDGLLVALLLVIAAGLLIVAWLPQMPATDAAAYSRWLSEAQARFGKTTQTLQALGLFTVTRSPGFRALLALLATTLSLRLIEGGDRLRQNREMAEPQGEWQALAEARLPASADDLRRQRYRVQFTPPLVQADRWPWAESFPLLAQAGGLLLLVGLLITHLWGWKVEGLVVQGSERTPLNGTAEWVALDEEALRIAHSPGIVTSVESRGPGVRVSAADSGGHLLELQQTAYAEPVTQLTMILTEDRYFAIPEAQLAVQLVSQSGHTAGGQTAAAHSPVLVQVRRTSSGQLVLETAIEGDTRLLVDDVTLELASVPYAQVTATFNPGLWPTGVGLVLSIAGLLGSATWPARRFWLRERDGAAEGCGDVPAALAPTAHRESPHA